MLRRALVLPTLFAATLAMVGCTDNPAQNPTSTGTSGGALADPFATLGKGAASLQQAAGMAGDARSSGLTTVAPLQQSAAGYRVSAVGDDENEADGPYTTTFHITSEKITGTDWTSEVTVEKTADYVTKSDEAVEIERGQAGRKLHLKNEATKYAVDVYDIRQVASSTRRAAGLYGTFGVQTLTATEDAKALVVYHQPTGQASTSLTVVMIDQYEEGSGGTLTQKIANRGSKVAEAVVLKGTLPTGESIDFTRGKAGKGNVQGRYFDGTLDLGANGKVGLKSTMGWGFTDAQPDFPTMATGSVAITKKTPAGAVEGEIVINKFDCVPAQQIAHTTGVLKNAEGATIGAFEGLISKRTGKWLGTYQMTGQASKSIDFSGIIEHMM